MGMSFRDPLNSDILIHCELTNLPFSLWFLSILTVLAPTAERFDCLLIL
uniref:Uncharacterized protein n=1 Tax=Arundo donax TaxID=35708 RepID=A0A0A8YXZ8_ARUDO